MLRHIGGRARPQQVRHRDVKDPEQRECHSKRDAQVPTDKHQARGIQCGEGVLVWEVAQAQQRERYKDDGSAVKPPVPRGRLGGKQQRRGGKVLPDKPQLLEDLQAGRRTQKGGNHVRLRAHHQWLPENRANASMNAFLLDLLMRRTSPPTVTSNPVMELTLLRLTR